MAKMLYMFPGQGSQTPGMGKEAHDQFDAARDIFAKAAEFTGMDIAHLCFEGSEEELKQTQNAQPAIFTCSYALCSVLRQKAEAPAMVAGHSLGEYTALTVAGMLAFKDAVKLVQERGRLMAGAGEKKPGTMAAIIGLDDNVVEDICKEASADGIVVPANYNSPGQLVISGETAGINKAIELAKAKGAKRALPLQVSAAFHSPLMQDAVTEFTEALKQTRFLDAKVPVISNVTARAVTSGDEMRDLLIQQLSSPVRWVAGMKTATDLGADTAVEIGSGKVLAGLLRRINRDMAVHNIESPESIQAFWAQPVAS